MGLSIGQGGAGVVASVLIITPDHHIARADVRIPYSVRFPENKDSLHGEKQLPRGQGRKTRAMTSSPRNVWKRRGRQRERRMGKKHNELVGETEKRVSSSSTPDSRGAKVPQGERNAR